jgi:phosphoribosylformylglycinamidine (FGAM) synthase PurS component
MQSVELLVKLKIPDVTALTAAGALRRRMGYREVLKSLRRADYYRLELAAADGQEAQALAQELAERTNVFVNPNKHVYEIRAGGQQCATTPAGYQVAQVLVTDPNDGSAEGALAALQGRLGYGGRVLGLVRGVLWTLELDCADRQEAERVAGEIAVTRRRDAGLLMNPHFQECVIH